MIGVMLIDSIGCPLCQRAKSEEGAEAEEVARAGKASMHGRRITTETAQLHRCDLEHDFMLHVQDGGYALLYERALQRVADGRTRDAVIDAYTSFDMFLASFVLGVVFDRRYPHPTRFDEAPLEPLREELKDVLRPSERTTAAALALACLESGRAPPRIPNRLNELRNKAVHAGAYPCDKDAKWACIEVERLVCGFREQVPTAEASTGRFQMALLLESTKRALGSREPVQAITYTFFTVLDATNPPELGRAAVRIEAYRRGALSVFIE